MPKSPHNYIPIAACAIKMLIEMRTVRRYPRNACIYPATERAILIQVGILSDYGTRTAYITWSPQSSRGRIGT